MTKLPPPRLKDNIVEKPNEPIYMKLSHIMHFSILFNTDTIQFQIIFKFFKHSPFYTKSETTP